ncbi:MAG: TonB-dependent receptor [Saprospiraceae bacterium]|nr:TonB-dependent receptor [Saprospiraceae bacterium]
MGPSRTLILINGKRKNMSSLLYTQTSPGRGETGADISAIPVDMIKRIEILRDGASAQYGSDAIAGVMNIILKDGADNGSFTVRTGITTEGDGESFGVALNNNLNLGSSSFLNYTVDLSRIGQANRPGTVDLDAEADPSIGFGGDYNAVKSFLQRFPDAGNINASPATTAMKFALNGGKKMAGGELYGNAAYIFKKVNSYANYRTPFWRTLDDFPYLLDFFGVDNTNGQKEYVGYVPTFDGNLADYNATLGFKSSFRGWLADVSWTIGGNEQTYTVRNSHNRNGTQNPSTYLGDVNSNGVIDADEILGGGHQYRENSPLVFYPGGTSFSHNVANIDITRRLSDKVGIAFGSEFRTENFNIIEGDLASYEDGGADSFAGNDPRNSGKFNRYNIGGYADLALDLTDDFLINGTARYENYSDFGDAFVYKVSSRYKMSDDKVTLRASYSTGFKAPTLHQIFTQKAQYSFVPGQGIQVGGLVSNVSREARLLGVPTLNPEKSTNFTVGLGLRPSNDFTITLDYYSIKVTDRILLSTRIQRTDAGDTELDNILNANNLSDLSFFVNGVDAVTSGLDFVMAYRGLKLGSKTLGINLSGNYTLKNERDGDVKNPKLVSDAGQSVVNGTQEALFFTSRPKYKAILGLDYEVGDFNFSLNNTLFGPTRFDQDGLDSDLYTEFKPKVVTDLGISYGIDANNTLALNINNLLNVVPEWAFKADSPSGQAKIDAPGTNEVGGALWTNRNLITFNDRYATMTYDGFHFSQLGTIVNLAWSMRL